MNSDEKILKALEDLQAGQKALQDDVTVMKGEVDKIPAIQKQLDTLVDATAHTNTALKTLPTKQDVETTVDAAKSELKADVLTLESKVVKKIQSHERRISNIEEHEGIENPDKN